MQFRLWFLWGSIWRSPKLINRQKPSLYKAVTTALRDRRLLVYVLVNIIFTIYFPAAQHFAPLLQNFVSVGVGQGFSETTISALFAWHLALAIFASCLLPVP